MSRVAKGTQLALIARVKDSKWLYVAPPEGVPAFILGDLLSPVPPPQPAEPATANAPTAPEIALLQSTETKAVTRTQGNGNSFQDCTECPVLVRIPRRATS